MLKQGNNNWTDLVFRYFGLNHDSDIFQPFDHIV